MLPCKQGRCSGIWYTLNRSRNDGTATCLPATREIQMSKTATIALSTPNTFFGRLVATLDRWLMAFAEANIRNGDIPRAGL